MAGKWSAVYVAQAAVLLLSSCDKHGDVAGWHAYAAGVAEQFLMGVMVPPQLAASLTFSLTMLPL